MVIILMGVAGVGKTTVGRRLAEVLGWRFLDADDFHSSASVARMRAGLPLTDEEREPWLERLRARVLTALEEDEDAVLACSALRRAWRERLVVDPAQVKVVYLRGPPELIARRLEARRGHFMPAALLASQYEVLEEPDDVPRMDVSAEPDAVVSAILVGLGLQSCIVDR